MGRQDPVIEKINNYGITLGFQSEIPNKKDNQYFKFNSNCGYRPDVVWYLSECDKKNRINPYCIFEVEWKEGTSTPAYKGLIGAICFSTMINTKHFRFVCNNNKNLINAMKGRINTFKSHFNPNISMNVLVFSDDDLEELEQSLKIL